jgi:4-amino-4-deoxy-L-arabinose transferase-like glycosyltransferase
MKINRFLNKNLILLFIIVIMAGVFRFWGVATNPPSLYWDEVSQGYNAYSVLTTGFDEHHQFLPITDFVAFGDNKAPVNIYLIVLSMIVFGKTAFAIRFPSVLFGSLTIICAFFLAREVFWQHKKRDIIALVAAGLLAVSPWHILLSRVSYEANIATFFTVLGLFLFFFAKRRFAWAYILSGISFVVGFYAFNSNRVFIPLIVLVLGLLYWKDLLLKKKAVLLSIIIGLVFLTPMMVYFLNPDSRIRFAEVNVFSDPAVVNQANTWLKADSNSLAGKIFDNRRIGYVFVYMKHYFDFFNPQYLFFTGDVNPRFSAQASGELWLWELPFILIGFYNLFRMKNKVALFVLLWFLFAPVAAATARETPHALRSETYIPVYELLASIGIVTLGMFLYAKRKIFFYGTIFVVGVVALFEGTYFIHEYLVTFPVRYSQEWQYGYAQAIQKTEKIKNNYDLVLFTNYYGRAYIYYLFYANVSPKTYWQKGNPTADVFGLYNVTKIGKYEFSDHLLEPNDVGKRVLYVMSPKDNLTDLRIIDKVNFLDGQPAFLIAIKK